MQFQESNLMRLLPEWTFSSTASDTAEKISEPVYPVR
jgi:hypothetical protein